MDTYQNSCRIKFGKGDKQVTHNGKRGEVFTVDKYPCLKWVCVGHGRLRIIKRLSGCMDRVTKKCIKYQWMNGVKCDKRICRISFRWSKISNNWKLQYGMVTSWKKRLVTCEHEGKCYKPDEEIRNKKDCTFSKCVILPPRWPRFSRTVNWIPSRAGCTVNDVCYDNGEKFKRGCNEYQCNGTVTMIETQSPTGRHYQFKSTVKVEPLSSGCSKPGGGCVGVGESYTHSKCLELKCNKKGNSYMLGLDKEGCPLNDGTCLDVGKTRESRCYKRTCKKTTVGRSIQFSVALEKTSGCSNYWDKTDMKCYGEGDQFNPPDEWAKKVGCTNGAVATCKMENNKLKLSAGDLPFTIRIPVALHKRNKLRPKLFTVFLETPLGVETLVRDIVKQFTDVTQHLIIKLIQWDIIRFRSTTFQRPHRRSPRHWGIACTTQRPSRGREVPRSHAQPLSTETAIAGPLTGVVSENRERVLRYEHLRK
ncbi:uncharacterized protein LOC121379519 [Gigantopelta aegis]|uniref:uncharacterized protein LOC121379519 n=1 Tax=Gigantopelta aegis TaxID=1735272 RepID=UPI001B88ACDD|nr:uncharacterized protein LOC121379519 [Gigantopelta aegis]